MTASTSKQHAHRLADIDARRRRAWQRYSGSLRDLTGRDYEEAETHSWDRLQKKLRQLDGERRLVEGG